ncbi:MAG: hypothetical protein IPI67_29155 [Myxococcales bacterium]|nr:hypothetical protein [Myxococcales bacterium]
MTRRHPSLASLLGAALVFSVCMHAPSARADEAADWDKKARAAFEKKDFAGAAAAFEEAYRVKPHPATKYNAALAWEKGTELARAADAFEAALNSEGLDEGRAKAARARLAVLKPMLGYVFVEKPIGATISSDHVTEAPIPTRFHLTPGEHQLVLKRRDGSTAERNVTLRAGATLTVEFEAADLAADTPPPTPPKAAPVAAPKPPPEKAPAKSESCTSCTWGWVSLGVGVAAAGAGAFFGVQTLSAKSEFNDSGKTDADARDRAINNRTLSNVAFGVAAVAGGVGLYLIFTGKKTPDEAGSASVAVGPGSVSGRFRF